MLEKLSEKRTSFRCCGQSLSTPFCPHCGKPRIQEDNLDDSRRMAITFEEEARKIRSRAETKRRNSRMHYQYLMEIPDVSERASSAEKIFCTQIYGGWHEVDLSEDIVNKGIQSCIDMRMKEADQLDRSAEVWEERAAITKWLIDAVEYLREKK